MALPPSQSQKSSQRSDMSGRQTEARVRTAQKAVNKFKRVIMTADGQQGAFNLFTRAQQLRSHGFSGAYAFTVARNPDHPVCAGKTGDRAGTARQRHCIQTSVHAAQFDPYALLHAGA